MITAALYQVRAEYYELDPRFFQRSPHGVLALAWYEVGQYERASRAWRTHDEGRSTIWPVWLHADLPPATARPLPGDVNDEQFARADALFVARKVGDAASIYRAVLEKTPASIDGTVGLACALSLIGDHASTFALWENVLNRGGVHDRTTTFLNLLTTLDDLEHARARPTAQRLLARTYAYRDLAILDRRMLGRVISSADQAAALDPTLAGAFVSKGVVYAKWGDDALALEQFTRATALRPTADSYRRLAEAAGRIGRLREEIEAYKQAVQLEPRDPHYAGRLGDVMLNKYGDFYQATDYLSRAYRLAPDNRPIALMYAYALDQLPGTRKRSWSTPISSGAGLTMWKS